MGRKSKNSNAAPEDVFQGNGEMSERIRQWGFPPKLTKSINIEDLLDVSRIITGKTKLVMRPVELADVIEAAIDTLHPTDDAKSIEIEMNLECEPCLVGGDAQRL